MSESVSAVEELIEKGARAQHNARDLDSNWDELADWQQFKLRKAFAAGLDAVFGPGWQEGIGREWGYRHADLASVQPVGSRLAALGAAQFLGHGTEPVQRLVTGWQRVEEEQRG